MNRACSESFLQVLSSPNSLVTICHVIACFEIPFHIIGTYCIMKKTPERMKNVKLNMLIKHFSTIFMSLSMSLFIIPFMMLPALAGVPLGVFSIIGISIPVQIYLVVTGPAVTGITILALFENRFSLLSENLEWKKIRFVYISLNYLSAVLFFVYPMIHIPDQNIGRSELIASSPCLAELLGSLISSIFIITRNPLSTAIPMFIEMFFSISQVTIITILTYQCLATQKFRMSQTTYQMQNRFIKALSVQFLMFITCLGAPVGLFTFSMLLNDYNQGLNNLCIIGLSLNGIISTLSMMALHQPYREWIIGFFKSGKVQQFPERSIATFH